MVPEIIHFHASGVSLVIDLTDGRLPRVLHWGASLAGEVSPDGGDLKSEALPTDDELAQMRRALIPQAGGFPVDGVVDFFVLPQTSEGDLGTPGLTGSRAGRHYSTAFTVTEWERSGAPEADQRLTVHAVDEAAQLRLRLTIEMTAQGLIRQRAVLTSTADAEAEPYDLGGLLLAWPVPATATELLDFSGHWSRERDPQRTQFTHGTRLRDNRRGATGFDTAYVLTAGTPGFEYRTGQAWGVHTAWSGNHRTVAERGPYQPGRLMGGELLESGEVRLASGASYTTPWFYGSYGAGLDVLSQRFHRWLRSRPQHPARPRPVTLNTWEAVYFNHDLGRLTALADKAASVGLERFVLDDGWFGGRRDDSAGLGDWVVSDEVWPDGLDPLIEHVTGLGMEFGLWVEPEMINLDSDLARAHPDWILRPEPRLPRESRHQQVLDLTNPDAFDHILDRLDALLTQHDIAYLKWDHNRNLVEPGRLARRGEHDVRLPAVHEQTLALYRLIDELKARHPAVEIESCSGGGGRIDLEILERTDRVWVSDMIDPMERVRIQRGTNLLIGWELMGCHIGSPRSHATGRAASLSLRALTALFGHLGVEWDLTSDSPDELAELTEWIALHKRFRALAHRGDVIHPTSPDEAIDLQGVVAEDRSHALIVATALTSSGAFPARVATLPGLSPDTRYEVTLHAAEEAIFHTAPGAEKTWWDGEPLELTGRALAVVGVRLPLIQPEQAVLIELTAVNPA